MPTCLITRRYVEEADAIGVYIGDSLLGYISEAAYSDMDYPEYKRATFDVPEHIEPPEEEKGEG